jgi:hypothetical protein
MRILPAIDGVINRLDRSSIWPWCWFDVVFSSGIETIVGAYSTPGLQYTLPCSGVYSTAPNTAPQINAKTAAETRTVSVSFVSKLGEGETLSNTPTVSVSPAGPSVVAPIVSAQMLPINGAEVDAGEAVQFSISGGAVGSTYTLDIVCPTSAGEILEGYCTITVVDA